MRIKRLSPTEREKQRERLWHAANHRCQRCGRWIALNEADRHHVRHKSLGGGDEDSNIKIVCRGCHNEEHGG